MMRRVPRSRLVAACLTMVALVLVLAARGAAPAGSARYEERKEHDPDGSGRFYMGREIALVMGHQAADWLERKSREKEERPDLLIPALRLKPGMKVADLGAGSGYHTRRMAKEVAPGGSVYAVDIQPEMLDLLRRQMKDAGLTNVIPVLGSESDPRLPADSIDLLLMVDVYHELSQPFEVMEAVCRSLKPGGRVVFVEFRAEDPDVPIKAVHKMSVAQLRREMAVLPLEWVETLDPLPWQHIVVFRKKAAAVAVPAK